jgi:hypothetical protein
MGIDFPWFSSLNDSISTRKIMIFSYSLFNIALVRYQMQAYYEDLP